MLSDFDDSCLINSTIVASSYVYVTLLYINHNHVFWRYVFYYCLLQCTLANYRKKLRKNDQGQDHSSGDEVSSVLKLCYLTTFWLNPSTPAVPNCCCSKSSAPNWSNPLFLISDILALSHERQSARMSKIKNVGLGQYRKL